MRRVACASLAERADAEARDDGHRAEAHEDDQAEDADLHGEQLVVVGAHALDVAARAAVDQVDEAGDRAHDHALLGEVGVVDEPPVLAPTSAK